MTFLENLKALLSGADPNLTAEQLAELGDIASRMTRLGVSAPQPRAAPKPDPKEAARTALTALPSELPRGSSDSARLKNAKARAQHLSVLYPHLRTDPVTGNALGFDVDDDPKGAA